MFTAYLKASVLAFVGHSLKGVGIASQTVASYIEHALLQVCEDINNERERRVAEDPSIKVDLPRVDVNRENMN